MRKYNSSIRTAFISEAGNQLRNNDYFGFVELDKFACYVIADGITGMGGAESAKSAISAAVDAFQREPGISRRKLKGYLRCANRELLQEELREAESIGHCSGLRLCEVPLRPGREHAPAAVP